MIIVTFMNKIRQKNPKKKILLWIFGLRKYFFKARLKNEDLILAMRS